jgi:hypothetical protein
MATRHATRFSRTGGPLLVREMGEEIIYYPNGGLTGRCITAIVERNVEIPSETGGQVAQALIVRVLDDCTSGIGANEINDGKDTVSIALSAGGTPERRYIARAIDDANGMVRFLVR